MRACTKCGEMKPLEAFPPIRRGEAKRQSWCRDCFAAYGRDYYRKNRDAQKTRLLKNVAARRAEVRMKLIAYLQSHPCVDCGEADIVVLEFDHLENKLGDISKYAGGGRSWERIAAEIAKCEVRCVNCHRRKTAERFASLARKRPRAAPSEAEQLRLDEVATRVCRVCGSTKSLADFPFRSKTNGTHHRVCRACQREISHAWYLASRSPDGRRVLGYGSRRRVAFIERVRQYLDVHPCVDCGEADPFVPDFDHLRDKILDVSTLVRRARVWREIALELEKCEVRCGNCHRRRTAKARGAYRVHGIAG